MKAASETIEGMSKCRILWKLFRIILIMSASTFGGGFVIISMMKKKFVDEMGWLNEEEMLDMTAIAQSSPGPLGVNIAVAVGYRLAGFAGALICTVAAVIPPLVIISVIFVFYNQFRSNRVIAIALTVMRAGVAAVIVDVVITLAENVIKMKSVLWIVMMIAAFVGYCFFDISAIILIIVCGFIGLINIYFPRNEKEEKK